LRRFSSSLFSLRNDPVADRPKTLIPFYPPLFSPRMRNNVNAKGCAPPPLLLERTKASTKSAGPCSPFFLSSFRRQDKQDRATPPPAGVGRRKRKTEKTATPNPSRAFPLFLPLVEEKEHSGRPLPPFSSPLRKKNSARTSAFFPSLPPSSLRVGVGHVDGYISLLFPSPFFQRRRDEDINNLCYQYFPLPFPPSLFPFRRGGGKRRSSSPSFQKNRHERTPSTLPPLFLKAMERGLRVHFPPFSFW